jgi:hypothetical protein
MLNPYIQSPQGRKPRPAILEEDEMLQKYGRQTAAPVRRTSVGLWVGRLLIRMGEKLTRQEESLKPIRHHA